MTEAIADFLWTTSKPRWQRSSAVDHDSFDFSTLWLALSAAAHDQPFQACLPLTATLSTVADLIVETCNSCEVKMARGKPIFEQSVAPHPQLMPRP